MTETPSIEFIIQELSELRQEHGKITQSLITDHSEIYYERVYDYFDSLETAKMETYIHTSGYIKTIPKNRGDYEPILLELLRKCVAEHGKVTRELIKKDDDMPRVSDYKREFETFSTAKMKAGVGSNTVIELTEDQLESMEDEMIDALQLCKKKHGRVNRELVNNMDTHIKVPQIKRQFGSFRKAKREALDNPNLGGKAVKEYTREEVLQAIESCEANHGEVKRDLLFPEYLPRSQLEKHFDTLSKAKQAAEIGNVGRTIITDDERERANKVIRNDEEVRSVIQGLLLGDGSIDGGSTNACLRVCMESEEFLYWVKNNYLNQITNSVTHKRTPEKGAERARETGFRPNANSENYSHIYELVTYRLDAISELRDKWYPNGEKRFPSDLELTPLSAKMWYCGDGGINIRNRTAEITCKTELERTNFIESLFHSKGFESVEYNSFGKIRIKSDSDRFLKWIGTAPPCFRYKWELENRDKYEMLKERQY